MKKFRSIAIFFLAITLSFIFSIVPAIQAAPEKNNQQKDTLDLSGLNNQQKELLQEIFKLIKKKHRPIMLKAF